MHPRLFFVTRNHSDESVMLLVSIPFSLIYLDTEGILKAMDSPQRNCVA